MIQIKGIYAITPECQDSKALLAAVAASLAGGCRIVQYRDKTRVGEDRLLHAMALRFLCTAAEARLIINDDVALALTCGADGVHLGRGDGDVAQARCLLGPNAVIGVSCYNDLDLAHSAVAAGASYVAFGAVYPSSTKPDAAHASLELLAQARASLSVPICAIGGITLANAAPVLSAGADMLAVISDLFGSPASPYLPADIARRSAAFQALF